MRKYAQPVVIWWNRTKDGAKYLLTLACGHQVERQRRPWIGYGEPQANGMSYLPCPKKCPAHTGPIPTYATVPIRTD